MTLSVQVAVASCDVPKKTFTYIVCAFCNVNTTFTVDKTFATADGGEEHKEAELLVARGVLNCSL